MAELRISDLPAHSTGTLKATDLIEVSEESGGLFTSTKMTGASLNKNFANTDLTFTAYRTHDLGGFGATVTDGFFNVNEGSLNIYKSTSDGGVGGAENNDVTAATFYFKNNQAGGVALLVEGFLQLDGLPTYANEAAAVTGGLATNVVYKTSTGELRIKL